MDTKVKMNLIQAQSLDIRNPGRNNQNAAKLIDKYNNLAREALSVWR